MRLPLLAAATLVAGCATWAPEGEAVPASVFGANYLAADALVAGGRAQLDPTRPIIVATVVDIDDLERSSTLGRFLSESVSARFTQNGFRMVEMKFQNAVYMKRQEGELMLARELREIATSHQAQAVVVGTYSRAASAVFVNLKVVRPESNVVIAAQEYSLPMGRDICVMIGRRDCDDYYR
ncbi:MAG TPA: FlgO family outer membrane protein [Usitatibacter sp.]|nr:FlgO family outer membrane protein [Usitatibacter sp.]